MVHFRFTYARFYVCKTATIGYKNGFPLLSLNISSQIQKARRMIQKVNVILIMIFFVEAGTLIIVKETFVPFTEHPISCIQDA